MGDGVLAYFGWPRAHEDEAERAVRAGLAIAAAVGGADCAGGEPLAGAGRHRDRARGGGRPGRRGCGAGAGGGRRDAEPRRPAAGARPSRAGGDRRGARGGCSATCSSCARWGRGTLKGIAEPVRRLRVLGERHCESRFEARAGGVAAARSAATRSWRCCSSAGGRPGPARARWCCWSARPASASRGIVRALLDALAGEPHIRAALPVLALPHRHARFWPVIQQLAHAAGFEPERHARGAGSTSSRRCSAQGRDDGGEAAPLIAALLGLDGGGALRRRSTLTPQQRRARTLAALVDQLLGLAAPAAGADGGRGRALDRPHHPRADRAGAGPDRRGAGAGAADQPARQPAGPGRPPARDPPDAQPARPRRSEAIVAGLGRRRRCRRRRWPRSSPGPTACRCSSRS